MPTSSRAFQEIDTSPAPELHVARELLESYAPRDDEQARFREEMLAFIDAHPSDAHERTGLEGHLTAACFLLDHAEERALDAESHAQRQRMLEDIERLSQKQADLDRQKMLQDRQVELDSQRASEKEKEIAEQLAALRSQPVRKERRLHFPATNCS